MAQYPLYIDDRDGSRDLMQYLPLGTELCRMEFGDAMVIGNGPADATTTIGVEVKSVSDLLQSANNGRLAGHQLPGMLETYDIPWLLTFGSYRPGHDGQLEVRSGQTWRTFRLGLRNVPYIYLESFLMDVCATGVRHKHVFNAEEAAIWLMCLHRWWSKRWSEHKGLKQFDCSKDVSLFGIDPTIAQAARVAQQLPGIGFDRAVSAAGHFRSIWDMMTAEWEEWARVPGIGKVIAKSVYTTIRRRI